MEWARCEASRWQLRIYWRRTGITETRVGLLWLTSGIENITTWLLYHIIRIYCCGLKVRETLCIFFFFNDTATTEFYPLSLPAALPIWVILRLRMIRVTAKHVAQANHCRIMWPIFWCTGPYICLGMRAEEHTSEIQSPVPSSYAVFGVKNKSLVCGYVNYKAEMVLFTV